MHAILRRLLPALFIFPLAAHGTIVTTTVDEDNGSLKGGSGISLREAVKYSPVGTTITFAPALSGQTIRLTLGQITINQSLTIDGSALSTRVTLSGDKTGDGKTPDDTRVIQISGSTTVVLKALTISGGSSNYGGGIKISDLTNTNTKVTVRNSTFVGNAASADGGAIHCVGTLDIHDSTFNGNSAFAGAGIYLEIGSINLANTILASNAASERGGAISTDGTLTMQSCAVTGNSSGNGGGIYMNGATVTLERSTVSQNTGWSGAGIYGYDSTLILRNSTCSGNYAQFDGGGIYQQSGSLLVENSTLAGNTAKYSAGGLAAYFLTVTLRNATVSGNTASSTTGGGILKEGSGILTLENSIVAGNAALNLSRTELPLQNISGTFTGTNNITSGNPLLAPLGNYGGPTQTMPPLAGSPAIDAASVPPAFKTDQRGFARIGPPDIGAAEYHVPANLATIVTTPLDEDGGNLGGGSGISLREAVKYSAPGATITFAPTLSGQVVRLTLGELLIARSLTIDGSALPVRITLSGDKTGDGKTTDDTRVINITTGTVVLDSLVITGGYCPAGASASEGGGVYVDSVFTQLTIRNSIFTGNSAPYGGAIYFLGNPYGRDFPLRIENSAFTTNSATGWAGAIYMSGLLIGSGSTFSGNTSSNHAGAIYSYDGTVEISRSHFSGNSAITRGGAIWTYNTLKLTDTNLSGNSAQYGGAIYNYYNGSLNVETSTLSANSSSIHGGGIYNSSGVLTVKNSTITGNYSGDLGGGIYSSSGQLVLEHATLTGNTALTSNGGLFRAVSTSLSANRSIIAGNTAPTAPNLAGAFIGEKTLTSGNPLLALLGDYGGPTQTMPPLPGSPAINAGGSTILPTDQRGFARVSAPDIGAVEYQGNADITRFWKLDFDGDGSPYGTEQALGTDPAVADSTHTRNLTAPALNASGHPVLSFGIGPAAAGTRWILSRSTDLLTFTEIYRYDGTTDTTASGITFLRTAARVTITDTTSPPGGGFYRFEAQF